MIRSVREGMARIVTAATDRRAGRALAGLTVDYTGTLINVGLSFVITPLFLRLLSPVMYGFWIAAAQILFFLNLMDAGASLYLLKGIAAARNERREEQIRPLVSTTFWTYSVLAVSTLLVGALIGPHIADWFQVPAAESRDAAFAFGLSVVTAAIALVAVPTFYGVLLGYQRIALANAIVASVTSLGFLFGLSLLMWKANVVSLALGQFAATVLGAALAIGFARRTCPELSIAPRYFKTDVMWRILGFSGYVQMAKVAFLASSFSDGILLAIGLGPASVAVYALTQKLATSATMFVSKVGAVVMPGFAELFAQSEQVRLQAVTLRLTRLTARFSILCALLVLGLNGRFVSLWVGPAMFGGLWLSVFFAYAVLRNGIIRNLSSLFYASGHLRVWAWLSLGEAISKVLLTLGLLPVLGLLAPVVATALSELLTGLYTPVGVARLVGLPVSKLLGEGVVRPLVWSLPTAGVLGAAVWWVPVRWGWLGLPVIAAVTVVTNILTFDWEHVSGRWAGPFDVRRCRPSDEQVARSHTIYAISTQERRI